MNKTETAAGEQVITLEALPVGKKGVVCSLTARGKDRRRMLDLGLVPGTVVEALRRSPAGDPTAYDIKGAVIALRSEQGKTIYILPL